MVTDNFEWEPCKKAVFYWWADAGGYGTASLILHLHQAGTEGEESLVNELAFDAPEGIEGEAFYPIEGGTYYFSSENTDGPWSVRGMCEDSVRAAGSEMALEGIGNQVSDNYDLPMCFKSVFTWWAGPGDTGMASLIAHLHKIGTDGYKGLANEATMDTVEGVSGETLVPLAGGMYFVTTENTSGPWTVNWVCRDSEAPVGTELDVSGEGDMVTENYELPACEKSVFVWSTSPDESGTASLIVHLHRVKDAQYAGLVNELEFDLTESLMGEALQALTGGVYYLTVENTSGPWTVRWECRD
jgi:hypothetical protein